jgi:hypothetical protein
MERDDGKLHPVTSTKGEAPSTSIHFRDVKPFKVQVKFYIPLFEGQIDVDALDKWINLLDGYYSIQKIYDFENITFTLLESLPLVKYWWEFYCERHDKHEYMEFRIEPTWEAFVDSLKEDFYPIRNYDDKYTRWMTQC